MSPRPALLVLVLLVTVGVGGAFACNSDSDCSLNFNQCQIFQGCQGGQCVFAAKNCDDGDVCTDDSCDANAAGGCVHVPHCGTITACSDQTYCFALPFPFHGGIVYLPQCVDPGPPNCDDSNVCTTDHCAEPAGCLHDPIAFDDHDVCTLDECDPSAGISHTALPGCCNVDAECATDKCTVDRQCLNHSCTGGTAVVCDDGDPCTVDQCSPSDGCLRRSRDGFAGLSCICSRAMPSSCSGVAVPRAIAQRSAKACKLIATASTAPTTRAKKLLGRVAVQLKRAQATATHFGRKAPACGTPLAAQLGDDQSRAVSAQQSL